MARTKTVYGFYVRAKEYRYDLQENYTKEVYATKELAYKELVHIAENLINQGWDVEEVSLGLPSIKVYFSDSEREYMRIGTRAMHLVY